MQCTLQPNSTDDRARVALSGEIRSPRELSEPLDPLETIVGPLCYTKKVLLDLSNARYISSTGIGWLLDSHKKFTAQGGQLVLHSIPPMVDNVLRLMKLETVLAMAATAAEAEQRTSAVS